MRVSMRTTPIIYYAAIDPGGGGGGGQPAGQPVGAPTPGAQPGSQGNGQGGFRGTFFQNVPDEVWAQIEPHVGGINQHVTQLQQRYAPFKNYRDEDLQGLANFSMAFDRDPVGQWMRMARALQENGRLDEDLDLDHLQSIVTGNMPEAGGQQPPQNSDIPPWAQALNQRLDKLEGGVTKFQTDHRTQVEDAVLQRQLNGIKAGLKKAGFTDETMPSQEMLLGAYIAHRGNAQAALQSFGGMRTNLLKGFTNQAGPGGQPDPAAAGNGNNDLDLPNGAPQTRQPRRGRTPRSGTIDSKTKAAAEQFLRSQGSQ